MCNAIWELMLILVKIITLLNEHYNARPTDLHISPWSEFGFRMYRVGNRNNCQLFGDVLPINWVILIARK